MQQNQVIDAVVIGRNEGRRLEICLRSLREGIRHIVYVDSGSTDGSQELARDLGAYVVDLDRDQPFTAARARNAGLAAMAGDPPDFVQFLDGDCELRAGWIPAALQAFQAHPAAVVICGRRRERAPDASIYNHITDREWDTPVGQAKACGGDALMRYGAVMAVGGYRAELIAGEEPELCLRLAREGGQIWRIDAEMTWHDAHLMHFSQWWRRMRRSGYAYAQGAYLHGAAPERHWRAELRRTLLWGAVIPVAAVILGLLHPLGWAVLLAYPLQILRLTLRDKSQPKAAQFALLTILCRVAELQGALEFALDLLKGRRRGLIEYRVD